MNDRNSDIVTGILVVLMVICLIGWLVDEVFHSDESNSTFRDQKQATEQVSTPQKPNQQEVREDYAQIRRKAKAKIKELGYAIEKEMMVTCDGEIGKACYAVKELDYYLENGNFKSRKLDRIYEITVSLKKYNEYEIYNIERFDRGKGTVRTLE